MVIVLSFAVVPCEACRASSVRRSAIPTSPIKYSQASERKREKGEKEQKQKHNKKIVSVGERQIKSGNTDEGAMVEQIIKVTTQS